MKKYLILISLIFLIGCSSVDIDATGHDWLKYSPAKKIALMTTVFKKLGVKNVTQEKIDRGVSGLGIFYSSMYNNFTTHDNNPYWKKVLDEPIVDIVKSWVDELNKS